MNGKTGAEGAEASGAADIESDVSEEEHIDEAAFLYVERLRASSAPNYSNLQFARLDESLAAHLDALMPVRAELLMRIGGPLLDDEPETMFVAVVLALRGHDAHFPLILQAASKEHVSPQMLTAIRSAIRLVPWFDAGPRLKPLLDEGVPRIRALALAGFGDHRVDPGLSIEASLASSESSVQRSALQAAGWLGRTDLLPSMGAALVHPSAQSRFLAAEAATLLGDRDVGLEVLRSLTFKPGHNRLPALCLCTQAGTTGEGHALLSELSSALDAQRLRIIASGYVGDAKYVPWLIDQMSSPAIARIAGEAFVHITGADFNLDQLEAMPPDDFEDGPTDDSDDDDVELPEDIALPWPDVARIKAWWMAHRGEFTSGQKLFLGKQITPERCVHVLKTGFQRQRVIAAHYRVLSQPGTVLFPTDAPAWRQQKLLESM